MTAAPAPGAVRIVPLLDEHVPEALKIEILTAVQPWPEAVLRTELGRDDRRYLVAIAPSAAGSEVVGFSGIALMAGDAHVMTLAVHPTAQRQGIGTRLVQAALDEAAAAGATSATLEVRASNTAALRMYRHAGFRDAGIRPGYYPDGEDAMIMWRHDLGG